MNGSWREDFLMPSGKELLGVEAYRAYCKLISHERYVNKRAKSYEVVTEYGVIEEIKNNYIFDNSLSVEEMAVMSIMYKKLRECIAVLEENDRRLIEEVYFNNPNLSYCKIAQKLRVPRSTLQSREKKVLEALKGMIEKG